MSSVHVQREGGKQGVQREGRREGKRRCEIEFWFLKTVFCFTEMHTCLPREKDGLKKVLERIMKHIEDMMILTSRKHNFWTVIYKRLFLII